jgi:predicted HNH restriction endonuclease
VGRITEEQLILPSLYLMDNSPQKTIMTSTLKNVLISIFKPSGEDAMLAKGRSDSFFTQKVRNLKSHDTLENLGYASYNAKKSGEKSGSFTLSKEGKAYLDENIDVVMYLLNNDFTSDDLKTAFELVSTSKKQAKKIETYDENLTINEGTQIIVRTKVYKRSSKLRRQAIDYYTTSDNRIKCKVCSFDFEEFYGKLGHGFIEIHHQKPVFQFDGDDEQRTIKQALENVIPVCSNCHRMIHRSRVNPLSLLQIKEHIDNAKK